MFESIVVPLDFGPEGDRAAALAGRLAATTGLPVELVSVVGHGSDRPSSHFELEYRERLLGEADSTSTLVVDDDVVGALTDLVDGRPDSLIVIGTRARGPLGSLVLGGTSEALLARSDRALLLVGPHAGIDVGPNLVIAVADANAGAALLPSVLAFSRQLRLDPWFVQVAPKSTRWWAADDLDEPGAVAELAGTARALGLDAQWDVLHGDDPAEAIRDFTACMGGGIVAVASRRWVEGGHVHWTSTARTLVHGAPYPILVQPLHVDALSTS